jgi:hypothetical protein
MTFPDLFFLASALLVLVLCINIAVSALRGRRDAARRLARLLAGFAALYVVALVSVSLVRPRRFFDAGERRCLDDWCFRTLGATVADSSTGLDCHPGQRSRTWVAVAEVSSVAKRIRQRARDARAEMEDRHGRRYEPCADARPGGADPSRSLSDELGPGESFRVSLAFRLPENEEPAGLVLHHGDFPGIVIIGSDQSFLHAPALLRLVLERPH